MFSNLDIDMAFVSKRVIILFIHWKWLRLHYFNLFIKLLKNILRFRFFTVKILQTIFSNKGVLKRKRV